VSQELVFVLAYLDWNKMAARNTGSIGTLNITNVNNLGDRNFNIVQTTVQSVLYKMRGYNASTTQFEHWVSYSPTTPPPSGASLQNIAIAVILTI